jgi:hypothetical protein
VLKFFSHRRDEAPRDEVPKETVVVPAGAPIRLEVYDRSEDVAWRMRPDWKSCSGMDVPVCADSTMTTGAFFQAEALK